jgi:hypothetical protein
MQLGFLRGECRTCGMPVSSFAFRCPDCSAPNQPNPKGTILALASALAAGGAIGAFGYISPQRPATQPLAAQPDRSSPADAQSADAADYGWLVKAMAECDEEAKHKAATLQFLIVPVISTGLSLPGWSPEAIADIGRSAKLLATSDALIGLRNHTLALYQKPLTFQVADPKTGTVYRWKPAVGVAALNTARADFEGLKLGFEIPENGDAVEWTPVINIKNNMCYWINVLVLNASRN